MNTQITTERPEWYRTLDSLMFSNILVNDQKSIFAYLIWNRKYSHKSDFEKREYVRKYVKISKIIHITKMFRYINENYQNIFSFTEQIIRFLKVVKEKRIEMLSEIKGVSETMKLSKGQKKRLITAQKILNTQNPNMCNEIGKVLNRLFIKDISLRITEYI